MNTNASFDEANILRKMAAGNEQAFNEIIKRYSGKIFGVALRILRSREQAKEIVQEVFIIIWTKRELFAESESIEAYCFTVAKNQTLKMLRKLARQSKAQYEYLLEHDDASDSTDRVDLNALGNEYDTLLQKAVSKLSREQVQVYDLFMQDLSYKEIASKLNITPDTVNYHLKNVRKFLRHEIQPHISVALLFTLLQATQS